MNREERAAELRGRILDSVRVHGRPLPPEMALAWHGYLAAALEWDLVSAAQHGELSGMLPEPPGGWVAHVFPGAGEEADAGPVGGDW